jgi:hypothetical protein
MVSYLTYVQYISERWNNKTSTIESRSGEVYSIQHYLIKFVSDVLQVDGFLRVPTSKTDFHDITEKLLKLALNIINLT